MPMPPRRARGFEPIASPRSADACAGREGAAPSQRTVDGLALVLTGGGARAAYQVGMLRFLAKRFPNLAIPILTGASAGALNAVALANHPGLLSEAVDELTELWSNLTVEQVFRVDRRSLASHVARFGLRLVAGGAKGAPRPKSLVDTAPLRELVARVLSRHGRELGGIADNVAGGRLRAIAITTTCYASGRSVTWFDGRGVEPWTRPQRVGVRAALSVDHVLASAALPLLFPAVRIGDTWHGDGEVRLAAPLSPALHLGARRVLAVSTRFTPTHPAPGTACAGEVVGYPSPAQVIGMILNAVFVDGLDQDALRLVQVNELLLRGAECLGAGLKPVDLFVMRPSRDLGELATHFESELPGAFRWMTRGLGAHETRAADSLSFVLFQPDYLRALIHLGERDAEAYAQTIESFIEH